MVEFEVDTEHEEMASWLMMHKLGANGCQLTSPDPGRSTVQATFENKLQIESRVAEVNSALDEYGLGRSVATLRLKRVEEEDWLAEWKRGLEPLDVGKMLLICPPWLKDELTEEQKKRLTIFIEPGLAFGTGFHATTRFCLQALEQTQVPCDTPGKGEHRSTLPSGSAASAADASCAVAEYKDACAAGNLSILDVGTGSGILAIAAALLLPDATIKAVENDPEACRVARENLTLNNVAQRIQLIEGETDQVRGQKFNVILSNLTCEDNVALLPEYLELLAPSGHMIMSGILEEKSPKMRAAIQQSGLTILIDEQSSGWVGLVVVTPSEIA